MAAQKRIARLLPEGVIIRPEEAFTILRDPHATWIRNGARRVLLRQPAAGPTEAFDNEVARSLLEMIAGEDS